MEGIRLILGLALIISTATVPAQCAYHSETLPNVMKEKITKLHFFLFDILSGSKPSAVEVARPSISKGDKSPTPFGSLFAIDDPIRDGPEATTSKVIGNAQGLYVSSSNKPGTLGLVMYVDFGFTSGKFNGSSFTVASRNPITEGKRELAVVGGRGRFRMARGVAKLKTYFLNTTNGDAIIEYHVTLVHY